MDINKIIKLAGVIIILFIVFGAGVFVGTKKADFSFRWAENYQRNFGGPRFNGHGVFGQIIKIDTSTSTPTSSLVINGRDNVEKIVLIKENTIINGFRNNIKPDDLKVDDYIVVIGDPNDAGQIEAKLIRLMPASPELQRGEPAIPMMKR
jgi:hypothetical protein